MEAKGLDTRTHDDNIGTTGWRMSAFPGRGISG